MFALFRSQKDTVHQEEQALSLLWEAPSVALLEIDMPGHEWAFLSHLLDGALLRVSVIRLSI